MINIATCACGDLKVEVSGEPDLNGICHCNNCKKRTGSAFGMSAYFKRSSILKIEGNSSCYELTNPADGSHQKRFFCSRCGTTVYWEVSTQAGMVGIAAGCFADNPMANPKYSASTDKKWKWVRLPWNIKKFT